MKTQLRRSQNTQLFRYFQLMWPEPLYSNGSGYEIGTGQVVSKAFFVLVKGYWQRRFLLSNLKVLNHLTMDLVIIPFKNLPFMSYGRLKSVKIDTSAAILDEISKKLSPVKWADMTS